MNFWLCNTMIIRRNLILRLPRVLVKQKRLRHICVKFRLVHAVFSRHHAVVRAHHIHRSIPDAGRQIYAHFLRHRACLCHRPLCAFRSVTVFHMLYPANGIFLRERFMQLQLFSLPCGYTFMVRLVIMRAQLFPANRVHTVSRW